MIPGIEEIIAGLLSGQFTKEQAQGWLTTHMQLGSMLAEGLVVAPDFRGFAHLGTGQYVLNNTPKGDPAELIISIATEEEKAGRVVGDYRDNEPDGVLMPEAMAVRLRFENVAGLDALESHLRLLREEHFAP